jgi:negative regulator of flagellin synthesis FlgM
MRIETSRVSGLTQQPVSEVGRTGIDQTTASQGIGQADQVILSQRASEVQLARDTLSALPQVRSRKVADLKRQIQAGAYKVDADAVARKLMDGGA